MQVGVLALQGAFREHRHMFESFGADVKEVRLPQDLDKLIGLVIPGGESTTMAKLMRSYGLDDAIKSFAGEANGVWGTCAGAISIATEIVGFPEQPRLNLMDISVARNAYGRQVSSFEVDVAVKGFDLPFHTVFIRAPRIEHVGANVEVLAEYESHAIMVRQANLMATVFHPELTHDARVHKYFIEQVCR
jgi:5'-phosphate synthase pdxT subunit